MSTPAPSPELHDINSLEDAATYLKTKPSILSGMARRGDIGALKVSRSWVFTREALQTFISENETKPREENPWGLTDRSAARVRSGAARTGEARRRAS